MSPVIGNRFNHTRSSLQCSEAFTHFNNLSTLNLTCLNMCNKRHKAGSIFASHSKRRTSPAAYKLSKFKPFLYTLSIARYFGIEAKKKEKETLVCSPRFSSASSSSLKSHKAPQYPAGLCPVYEFNEEERMAESTEK